MSKENAKSEMRTGLFDMLNFERKRGLDECSHRDRPQVQEPAPGEKILAVGCSLEMKAKQQRWRQH